MAPRVLFTLALAAAATASAPAAKVGAPAPAFSLRDLAGAPLTLERLRGKVVLLDFWATWCEPCREAIPHLVALQKELGPKGLAVVGISIDDEDAPVVALQRQLGMNYPVARGDAQLAERYGGILGVPTTFVIDRNGVIRARHDGPMDMVALRKELLGLLAASPAHAGH